MSKRYVGILVAFFFVFIPLQAQSLTTAPKLIVNIHIDGLSSELLARFKDKYETGGFDRFLNYGIACSNVYANAYNSNNASVLAAIHSGAHSFRNGIIASSYYNVEKGNMVSCFTKSKEIGTLNPQLKNYVADQMVSSTFEDELLLYYPHQSRVYSVAPNAMSAVLSEGHSGQGAYWIDDRSGQWNGSSAYSSFLPSWIIALNETHEIDNYFNRNWELLKGLSAYDKYHVSTDQGEASVKHIFPLSLKSFQKALFAYGQIKKTPFVNTLITDFATQLLEEDSLGKKGATDVLNVSYDINDYWGTNEGVVSFAREDQYLRMDRELARLISVVGESQGIDNVLFVLTGTGTIVPLTPELKDANIPSGSSDLNKISALLNSFLMAVYGAGNWVLNYSNSQIYLNKKLIESKQLKLDDVVKKTVELCKDFSAIEIAIPVSQLVGQKDPTLRDQLILNALCQDHSGDLYVVLKPGRTHECSNSKIPLFWYGWKSKKHIVNDAVSITQIAPTLCNALKIPLPNGSIEPAIPAILDIFSNTKAFK